MDASLADKQGMPSAALTPLRWAGSKKRLLRMLAARVPKTYLRYIESFAGSAVLFYHLQPRRAILADVNNDLISFYQMLRRKPRVMHELLDRLDVSRATYQDVRNAFRDCVGDERASNFWYLNRCCFNGIYRTNRSGHFNVPFGSKLPPMPGVEDALKWSRALHHADLLCVDFERAMEHAREGDFAYMDPPYARSGTRDRGEYGLNALQPEDIQRVVESARAAADRGARVLISYNVDISPSLPGWTKELVNVRRDVAARSESRKVVREYLFRNYPVREIDG